MTSPLPIGHEYLLIFLNGKVLRTQSPMVVAHYRSDARLAAIHIAPKAVKPDAAEHSDCKVWLEGACVMRQYVH